jgi:hypothetical protein
MTVYVLKEHEQFYEIKKNIELLSKSSGGNARSRSRSLNFGQSEPEPQKINQLRTTD